YLLDTLKAYAQNAETRFPECCMLVWVISEVSRRGTDERTQYRLQQAHERLAAVKAELEAVGLTVNAEVRQGDTFTEITDAALDFDISAIATSYVTRGAVLELAAPSFANEVVRRSWFPVLFFSPES
ncbi:MAG: universal stress protein, partial [Spirulinaceae cyanobacterium RM2_2_10]|nr:universal stress protein [Spirulinaceae cyanobacterium RM2_2_10]